MIRDVLSSDDNQRKLGGLPLQPHLPALRGRAPLRKTAAGLVGAGGGQCTALWPGCEGRFAVACGVVTVELEELARSSACPGRVVAATALRETLVPQTPIQWFWCSDWCSYGALCWRPTS